MTRPGQTNLKRKMIKFTDVLNNTVQIGWRHGQTAADLTGVDQADQALNMYTRYLKIYDTHDIKWTREHILIYDLTVI